MERQLTLRVIVERPPGDVDFGIQEGHGNDYKTVQKQRYTKEDLRFEFPIRVREGKNGRPNFFGSFAQGPANNRFIYLDIGPYAGQTNTPWGRRLKTSRVRFIFSVQTLLERQQWSTRAAARTAVFEYIEIWYNRQRRHSTLGYQSPWRFEQRLRFAA